ncbi:class I SAM-dependent methyltransferase [Bacillus sp. 165]|uniref:class I SAM-dependent methyltransferase n=1 Tax=Bacillus sp. 165 TaxID=1529117 RepID=UPI001ADAE8F7|nr:class I SAM-dependent methyltransferase [Bacillus sp. 165]MBO9128325.1 methyltransferase domain-containing protein [Bacillus sp. 165]
MSIDFHSEKNRKTYASRTADHSWYESFSKLINVKEKKILDVGCGGGIYTKALAEIGAGEITAFDFSEQMLKTAKEFCKAYDNIIYMKGDAHTLNLPNDTFDVVISRAVIHHLADIPAFFREAYRVLKPNGVIVIQDRTIEDCILPGSKEHIRGYFFDYYPKLIIKEQERRPNSHDVQKWFREAGFQNIQEQNLWEIRKVHSSLDALLKDLSPRTGRSILHELTDKELQSLLDRIRLELQNTSKENLPEKDRWTIWTAKKDETFIKENFHQ